MVDRQKILETATGVLVEMQLISSWNFNRFAKEDHITFDGEHVAGVDIYWSLFDLNESVIVYDADAGYPHVAINTKKEVRPSMVFYEDGDFMVASHRANHFLFDYLGKESEKDMRLVLDFVNRMFKKLYGDLL